MAICPPKTKLSVIEDSQRARGMTAMVGDDINDAPSLAQSTSASRWAAPEPTWRWKLPTRSSRMRSCGRTSFSLGIKPVFLVLAVFGSATMSIAVFADIGDSLLVVANCLRLLHE